MTVDEKTAVTLVAIDDDQTSLDLVKAALKQGQLEIVTSTDVCEGLEIVLRKRPQIVLLDLIMPKLSGMDLLERIIEAAPETDVILITGHYSTESAVEAIRKGASDYLEKPLSIGVLRQRVGKLVAEARQRQRAFQLDEELLETSRFEDMVGRSPLMLNVFARIRRAAPHFRTALVTGATGTGKELVTRALHRLSPVGAGPLVVCNCSAIVETLFESELFGHVKGAFTGAAQDKAGFFEYAGGGTLFLDEIGDMPLAAQAKLLRAVETREFQRVGSPAIRRADVKVVAATNRNLQEMMAKNQFRKDLYYRISMVEIALPNLAERKEDLPLLQRYFLDRFAAQYDRTIRGVTPRAQIVLARYSWPGNVRELENVLGNACMMTQGEFLDVRDLPERIRVAPTLETGGDDVLLTLEEVHRRHALRVLEYVKGNKVRAAEILGINRATLYRLLAGSAPEVQSSGGEP